MKKNLRLFVVDDSPHVRARVIESMADHNIVNVVGTAECEDEAFDAILNLKPDAVVLDIQLRVGNGLNVLRRIKALPVDARPIVIVFTNHANPEFRRHALDQGAMYFLDKAHEFTHLQNLLNTLGKQAVH